MELDNSGVRLLLPDVSGVSLSDSLLARLRDQRGFQAARYEIIAAVVFLRAGFKIEFLDDGNDQCNQKHCELIASHEKAGIRIGVEAKVRRRPGVLHHSPDSPKGPDWRAIENLIRKARKQKPDGLPLAVFVDINLPPEPGYSGSRKTMGEKPVKGSEIIGATFPGKTPLRIVFFSSRTYHYYLPVVPDQGFSGARHRYSSLGPKPDPQGGHQASPRIRKSLRQYPARNIVK